MHPFAKYIQILGKGRNGMRSLTREQAYEAMQMITCYDVQPEQLGAFLMLMRVKEETPAEVAGFVQALRASFPNYPVSECPAIDWPAYAGKKRQLPWFLLAALVLARQGYPVLMHGLSRDDDRLYVPEALHALDMDVADSMSAARSQLRDTGFAYVPVGKFSSLTSELIASRELFGLRPPLHTVARMLNPLSAPLSVMGVFHPNFAEIHQQAALLLGQARVLVCKGEGGEFERIPDRAVGLFGVEDREAWTAQWDHMIRPGAEVKPRRLNLAHFRSVWDGEAEDTYGESATVGTLAMVIRALGIERHDDPAYSLATQWWQGRHQNKLPAQPPRHDRMETA